MTYTTLIYNTRCNKCKKHVESYAVYYEQGAKEPQICQCENNQLVIMCTELKTEIEPKNTLAKLDCTICGKITVIDIPDIITKKNNSQNTLRRVQ